MENVSVEKNPENTIDSSMEGIEQQYQEVKKFEQQLLKSNEKYMDDFKNQMEQHQKVIDEMISANTNFMDASMNMLEVAGQDKLSVEKEVNNIFNISKA